jgi:hypothetical protein
MTLSRSSNAGTRCVLAGTLATAALAVPSAAQAALIPLWSYAHRTVNVYGPTLPYSVRSDVWYHPARGAAVPPAGSALLRYDSASRRLLLSCQGNLVFRVGQSMVGARLARTLHCDASAVVPVIGSPASETIWVTIWQPGQRGVTVGWPPVEER